MDVKSSSGGNAYRHYMLTAIYGWKPGAGIPVPGINEDDYKIATQVILWEYQQQLRSDPYSRHGNGHANADQYFSIIAGRPAEKAYNWILSQVASHATVLSFTSTRKREAPELELKWDTEKKIYTLTVTDTNNLNINLETLKGSGVSVSRSGNKYTFTSKNMIMDPVTFEFRKDIPVANDMLSWGRPGYQTMMTGASDPVSFFVKIKTETYGTGKIVKTSEDALCPGSLFTFPARTFWGIKSMRLSPPGKTGRWRKSCSPAPIW
uniref:thioester domain-containing protein n=1 Tax=Enterocloster clostridioformis TaxID=1531 RepID=UPI002F3F2DB6